MIASYYVRPRVKKGYGNGNGANYADAWNGLEAIEWDKLGPDCALYVAGSYDGGKKFKGFNVQASGADQKPLIIKSHDPDPAKFNRYWLAFDGQSQLRFDGLAFTNSGQIRGTGATNILFSWCVFSKLDRSNVVFVELDSSNHDWWFLNCRFSDCPNAIYTRSDADGRGAMRLLVQECIFRRIGTPQYPHPDGHAIGVQGGSGHIIKWVITENTGTAICFWGPSRAEMKDIEVRGCAISNCRVLKNSMGSGIEISGSFDVAKDFPRAGWRAGISIVGNVIDKTDGNGVRATLRDAIDIRDNEISRYGLAGENKEKIRVFNPFAKEGP